MSLDVYLVNQEGVRAQEPSTTFLPMVSLQAAIGNAKRWYTRFVILDARRIQVYSSDIRDCSGVIQRIGAIV